MQVFIYFMAEFSKSYCGTAALVVVQAAGITV